MTSLISFFIQRRRVTNLLLILIILMGILAAVSLRRQGYPAINFDILKITTSYPGASPADVEINVTDPIEDEILEVEDIDEIKSLSLENISMILVYVNLPFIRPMVLAMAWGLLFATLITLIFTPVLYSLYSRAK